MQADPRPHPPYSWKQRAIVAVPLAVAVAALLVACGGGSSGNGVSQDSSSESMKTAQAVSASGSASVPAGWTGRPPKYEVINGITVPPEPAPSVNNATLAGVDLNGNGVRDDVERKMALKYSKDSFPPLLVTLKSYQILVTGATPKTREEALLVYSTFMCSANGLTTDQRRESFRTLFGDTLARKEKITSFMDVLTSFSPEELSPCN